MHQAQATESFAILRPMAISLLQPEKAAMDGKALAAAVGQPLAQQEVQGCQEVDQERRAAGEGEMPVLEAQKRRTVIAIRKMRLHLPSCHPAG